VPPGFGWNWISTILILPCQQALSLFAANRHAGPIHDRPRIQAKEGEGWLEAMAETLDKLSDQCAPATR
ncbi:MAG: hypothetical protein ACYDAQ_09950, partial [Mycobacteriales bacterium]